MVNTGERKLALSGWLKETHATEYNAPLRLQKFLFFYEAFSKIQGKDYDFSSLKGYRRGPVFSNVWGDYTKERYDFDAASISAYKKDPAIVDQDTAESAAFLTSVLSEKELSSLTHQMNIWKSQEKRILSGEKNVPLSENDMNVGDTMMLGSLIGMFPAALARGSRVIGLNDTYFVFSKEDIPKLTEEHADTLYDLSWKEELNNPVYVSIDDDGRLIVD